MAKIAMLGLTAEQIDGVLKIFDEEQGASKAKDRERQRRFRERKDRAEQPFIKNGKVNEGEWHRRRQLVFERDKYTCTYCGADASSDPQCDHIHPVSQGGSSEIDNLTTACRFCNSSKAGKLLSEWGGRA
jgi:5-methylcytosine-specific restriction endonuclease McrA